MRDNIITIQKVELMPVLASCLPYRFSNDTTFDSIETLCERCKKEIGPSLMRGQITETNRSVISLEAYALCYDCKIITPVVPLRIRDDGSMLSKTPDGWKESRYAPEQTIGLMGQLISLFIGGKK